MDRIDLAVTLRNQASPGLRQVAQDVRGVEAAAQRTRGALGGIDAGKADAGIRSFRESLSGAREQAGGLSQSLGGVKGAIGALGAAFGAQQLIAMGMAAGQMALGLEKARSTAALLAGDTARYNQVIEIARQNQILFGGSLQENVQGLASLAGQARKSGIDLSTLNDLSQRLNLLSPEQGLEGASIALREALSGDTQSLVERFELPRRELAKLRDTTITAAERAAILNKVLEDQGVKAGAVAGTIGLAQQRYNFLGQTIGDLQIVIGDRLAGAFDRAAAGLGVVIQAATNGIVTLFAFSDALKNGASVQDAWTFATGAGNQQYRELLGLAPGAQAAQEGVTEATGAGAGAAQAQAAALAEQIGKSQDAALAAQHQAEVQDALNEAGARVALGFSTQAVEAELLRQKYPELGDATEALIEKQARLAQAADLAAARLAAQAGQTRDLTGGRGPVAGGPGRSGAGDSEIDRIAREQKTAKEAAEALTVARRRQTEVTESAAARVNRLRREEEAAAKQYGKGSAEYVNAQTERIEAERRLAAERDKGSKAGSRSVASALEGIETRTEEHYRKLNQLQEEYQLKSRRSQEDFTLSQSRSQEDFERQRRKLLAEGKIQEANQLTEDFNRTKARAQEDFNREQARSAQDQAIRVGKESADAQSDLARLEERAGGAAGAGGRAPSRSTGSRAASASLASVAAGGPLGAQLDQGGPGAAPTVIQVVFNARVILDGKEVGALVAETVEQRIVEKAMTIEISSPPRSPVVSAVGGPRPGG